jgi:non-ribosomal peptide synthetase component F
MAGSFQGLEGLSFSDQILFNHFGHGSHLPSPFTLIHKAFEHVVDQQPDTIAMEHDGRSLTYLELERAANGLANRLIAMGLPPRQRVCLVVQRSLPMVIAMLAILKCGCQYVPLDGQVTAESALRHIMKDTNSKYVLCLEKFHSKVMEIADPACRIVVLDGSLEQPASIRKPLVLVTKFYGAYCIYTSGSTGEDRSAGGRPLLTKARTTKRG